MMKVYISGALQASRDLAGARALYEAAALAVEEAGHTPYLPHKHTDPVKAADLDAVSVFRRDMANLRAADLVVAFLDEPSLGVGAELVLAREAGTPVLALHAAGTGVSRFVAGYLSDRRSRVETYVDRQGMADAVVTFVTAHEPHLRRVS
ncbi:nucleoside 2-deoxyribosyltransferase [Methylobacterium sp. 1030]|uniref:nucleoside 2-deoxyribosyltransferase n=1 Tax=Methylobacterium sp. 1030 TaxID=3156404 RepID=UPI003397BEA2